MFTLETVQTLNFKFNSTDFDLDWILFILSLHTFSLSYNHVMTSSVVLHRKYFSSVLVDDDGEDHFDELKQ